MTLSGTITAAGINTDLDSNRAALASALTAGDVMWTRSCIARSVLSSTAVSARSRLLLLDDDAKLEYLGLTVVGGAYSITTTARLQAIGDGITGDDSTSAEYLQGEDVTVAVSTTDATRTHGRTSVFLRTQGDVARARAIWLKRGVLYRLSIECSDASNPAVFAQAVVIATSRRRL